MHQLSIDHDTKSVSISDHSDFDDAHRALMTYVVGADYYLRPLGRTHPPHQLRTAAAWPTTTTPHTFGSPASPARGHHRRSPAPHRQCRRPTTPPATRSAGSASTTARGDTDREGDPGHRYPMTVLTMAHAEAHYTLRAGSCAARSRPTGRSRRQPRRRTAHSRSLAPQRHLQRRPTPQRRPRSPSPSSSCCPPGPSDHQTAALVWYYALILWGANAT